MSLAGEGSIDVGGAFRETLTLACSDLMTGTPALFIENPNSVNGVGLNREKRIINPRATSPLQLEMYRCACVLLPRRLHVHLTVAFPHPVDTLTVLVCVTTSCCNGRRFRFVGALFAMALRSKFTLPVDLAVTVWKQVLGETLNEDDLDRCNLHFSRRDLRRSIVGHVF